MGNADSEHFESYRVQTTVKHQILTGYLPAYFTVLRGSQPNLVFIDGFAGRGYYLNEEQTKFPGSPILAMQLLASDSKLRDQVLCHFIEVDKEYAFELEREVDAQQRTAPLKKPPNVRNQAFSKYMSELRAYLEAEKKQLAPTFLFVDPCGVAGVKMSDLVEVLGREYCELFLFFNYEGINRIAGNAEGAGSSTTLVDLLGSSARVDALVVSLKAAHSPLLREQTIVKHFIEALKAASGAAFLLPFRVEHEHKAATSHYLLHATKHPLGFRIMKSVMSKAARAAGSDVGLELLQASGAGGPSLFEHADVSGIKTAILNELKNGAKRVGLFRETWVERPGDLFSEEDYKSALLDLETDARVVVLDKNMRPKPSDKRMRKGQVTLGVDCYVKLPDKV